MRWSAAMSSDVLLGIMRAFRFAKAVFLMHVGIEIRHVTPSAGKGELHVSVMYRQCISCAV